MTEPLEGDRLAAEREAEHGVCTTRTGCQSTLHICGCVEDIDGTACDVAAHVPGGDAHLEPLPPFTPPPLPPGPRLPNEVPPPLPKTGGDMDDME